MNCFLQQGALRRLRVPIMILEDARGTKKYVRGTGVEKVLLFYIF
jgi:hypothetical protein